MYRQNHENVSLKRSNRLVGHVTLSMHNFQTRFVFGYIIIVYNTHFKYIGYIHTIWHTVKVDGVYLRTTFLQLLRFKLTRQYTSPVLYVTDI